MTPLLPTKKRGSRVKTMKTIKTVKKKMKSRFGGMADQMLQDTEMVFSHPTLLS